MRKIGRITVQVLVVLCCVNQPLNMYSQGFFKSLGRELKNTFKDSFNNRTNQNQNGYDESRDRERQERERAEKQRQEELRKQKEAEEARKQQEEEAKKIDFYTFAVDPSVWMPKNPALSMTEEERTAKYNQMKAANSFKLENGIFMGMHKVMPNLFTLDFQPSSDVPNCGNLIFTALDGTVFTVAWDEKESHSGSQYNILKSLYNTQDGATLDYLDFKWTFRTNTTGTITTPKGDYIKLTYTYQDRNWGVIIEDAKIMDKERKGDYIIYTSRFGDFRTKEMYYFPTHIRKTLSDCTIEMPELINHKWGLVTIYYPNGDVYEGTLNVEGKAMRNATWDRDFNNAVLMTSIIKGADSLADVGTISDGVLRDRQNNVKVYINGQYDEIESIACSQRIQAEENAKKAKAQAAIKQKQKLIQKYGQKYVNSVLKPGVTLGECLAPGMPIGLLKELSDAGKISLEFRQSIVHTNSICYEVYDSNNYKSLGYVWTDKYKITSMTFY